MTKENNNPFQEVVPGVLVSREFTLRIPHPEQCFILMDPEEKSSWVVDGKLAIFSSQEAVDEYLGKVGLTGAVIKEFQWEQLVDELGDNFSACIVDYSGEIGFYTAVPLRKGI